MKILQYLLTALVVIFFSDFSRAQINLVPNPGFELYDTCPDWYGQLSYAIDWNSPNDASPDYWNACDTGFANVPNNIQGFQLAHSGNAFGGFILGRINVLFPPLNQYREYVQTQLIQPLQAGQSYCVTFYVNRADSCNWAVSNIGAYFSVNPDTNYATKSVLLYTPQVSNNTGNIIADTVGWTKISGSFIAAGGEKYLMIGNFNSYQTTTTQFVGGCGYCFGEPDIAYYFIDDVCVSAGNCNDACSSVINPLSDSCLQRNIAFSISGDSCLTSVKWNFGDPGSGAGNTSNASAATHKFSAVGSYLVTAVITSPCKTDTLRRLLNIVDCDSLDKDCEWRVPNVFTPNGDGLSDRFKIDPKCPFASFVITIYNRWGQVVFATNDSTKSWDGTFRQADCAEGVYFYTITYSFQQNQLLKKSGNVTLIR